MAQPNKYEPKTRFSTLQQYFQRSNVDPVKLDLELNSIAEILNDALERLALIQRDDGFISDRALTPFKASIHDDLLLKIHNDAKDIVDDLAYRAVLKYAKKIKTPNAGTAPVLPIPPLSGGGSIAPPPASPSLDNYVIEGKTYGANIAIGFRRAASQTQIGVNIDGLSSFGQAEVTRILTEANAAATVAVFPDGVYTLDTQIKLSAESYPNVKGIQGAGMGKTVFVSKKPQTKTWNPDTNNVDVTSEAVVLFDGVDGKVLKDISVWYQGKFYEEGVTYFGCVNTVMINNSKNCLVENVEATGANRVGIMLSANGKAYDENARYYRGELGTAAMIHHGKNNVVRNCFSHHNRVAGVMIENQISPRINGCTANWNGHERDGGTGYGIVASSGSVNNDVVIEENLVEKNYRKGIDSHDAETFIVRKNTIIGNRFFGVAIESRGYPMKHIDVSLNAIIQDPDFRLSLDDNHADWSQHRNSDYYRYTSVRIENKSQPGQQWKNQPASISINVIDNYIDGIEWDSRGISRVFELRNHEQAGHVRLTPKFERNIIRGKRVHNILFAIGEGTAYNGLGNFSFSNNNIKLDAILDEPISIGERNNSGFMHGALKVEGNTFDASTFQYSSNISLSNRALVKINGNTIVNTSPNGKPYFALNTNSPTLSDFEVMNNIFVVSKTAKEMQGLVLNSGKADKNKVNVFGNRLASSSGEVIEVSGYKNTQSTIQPNESIEAPAAKQWKDGYVRPQATAEAPQPLYKPDFNNPDTFSDGNFNIVLGGANKNKDYGSMFDLSQSPKIAKSMLLSPKSSAGVYPRATFPKFESGITTVFGIKIKDLGARATTGVAINGFGSSDTGSDVPVEGGIVAIQGSSHNRFKFSKTVGIFVDGMQYDGSELEFDRWYVVVSNAAKGVSYANYGSPWNGNGQVTADIANKFEIHNKILNATEAVAASVRVLNEIENQSPSTPPDSSGSAPAPSQPPSSTPSSGEGTQTEPPVAQTGKSALFSMSNAQIGAESIPADAPPILATSVKVSDRLSDDDSWQGMVVQDGQFKALKTIHGGSGKSSRFIRVDNVSIENESSVIIFPFKMFQGGHSKGAPIVITVNESVPVSSGNAKVSEDGVGWNMLRSNGFTLNGEPIKETFLLQFDKWYIGMIKQDKPFNSIRFGTNHVGNIMRNVLIGEGWELATGINESEIQSKYEAIKLKYGIE